MSGRRRRARGRARSNKIQDCYGEAGGSLDDRPAFDSTPFDPTSAGSAWDTLPTQSIFESTDSRRGQPPDDWLSSPYPDSGMAPNMTSSQYRAQARGRQTATPLLRRVLDRDNTPLPSRPSGSYSSSPFSPGANYSRASGLDSSRQSPGLSGEPQFPDFSDLCPYYPRFDDDDDIDVNDHDEYDIFATIRRIRAQPSSNEPIVVDTSPLPPWKPHRASERLEEPNNPPPIFHPMFANEWRTDPNMSEDMRYMYDSSCSEYSGNHCIYDYGKLSEFNTQNLYDPERFAGLNDQGGRTPAYKSAYCTEVFGDPHEALARPTDDVPDKYRKEKWHYFELKQRLELFKKLGMETDLAMYEGQLERMEADPWTGDASGKDVQVYMRNTEGDPAWDDDLLEQMEALTAPDNEGLKAFYEAMANPPPIRDESTAPPDCQLLPTTTTREIVSLPVAAMESLSVATMETPPVVTMENSILDDSFHTCIEGDDSQMGDIDFNESFHTCAEGDNDTQIEDLLNTTISLPDNPNLNTSFTIYGGPSVYFPPGVGPDGC